VRNASFVLLVLPFLYCEPAYGLVGADFADGTLQRYTVVVASSKGRCSGVVLARDVVLTAAHCIASAENVWVGGNRGWGDPTYPPIGLSPVAEAVQHPGYDAGHAGTPDLAVLKLAKPLPDRFIPVFLGTRLPGAGDDVIAVGYGNSTENDPAAGTVLRMVLLHASYGYSNYLGLTSTREDRSVGGPGDSGTPVFTYRGMHVLAGIIVGGSPNYAVAVAIALNHNWIKETVERLSNVGTQP
jgi:hypothetical protein